MQAMDWAKHMSMFEEQKTELDFSRIALQRARATDRVQ